MTNNHLDAALWISRSNAMDAEILVPCSYGDQMNAKHIQNNWPRRLRARTTFLKDFLPIEEWNELASNYSIKVFNHVRQEALGNILQAIANGQTVFINPRAISREFLGRKLSGASIVGAFAFISTIVGTLYGGSYFCFCPDIGFHFHSH